MAEPTLIQMKTALSPDSISVGHRLRPISEAGVQAILGSVGELGQIVTPLVVRQRRDKNAETGVIYELLDGAHRLEVGKRLGLTSIPVRVFECTNDQAKLLEIDGNLAGAELNPLDTAVFLATRKAVYERLHPETKAATGAELVAKRWSDTSDIMSFVSVTAEKFGLSKRHVERLVAAGSKLGPDEIEELRRAPRQVTLKDLQDIAQIKVASDRYLVVKALADGEAKNAAAAVKALSSPDETAPKDPIEEQLKALNTAWARAGAAARRRFADEHGVDLIALMGLELTAVMRRAEKAA